MQDFEREPEAFELWAGDAGQSMQKVHEITGIPVPTLYRWRKVKEWEPRLAARVEGAAGEALARMSSRVSAAARSLIQIAENEDAANRDRIAAIKLIFAYTLGDPRRAGEGKGDTFVDKQLVLQMGQLDTADLVKLAAGSLDANILDASMQRASKRQTIPSM